MGMKDAEEPVMGVIADAAYFQPGALFTGGDVVVENQNKTKLRR